jgi:hypothetical protein
MEGPESYVGFHYESNRRRHRVDSTDADLRPGGQSLSMRINTGRNGSGEKLSALSASKQIL